MSVSKSVSKIQIFRYQSPCGVLLIGVWENKLCLCDWEHGGNAEQVRHKLCRTLRAAFVEEEVELHRVASSQLDEYFFSSRTTFSLPFNLAGTEFQQRVWHELLNIPYGETVSYGQVALRIGRPSSVRAVANAVGANPLSLLVPCHRVIGSDHSLTGYNGGLDAKRFLLQMESKVQMQKSSLLSS